LGKNIEDVQSDIIFYDAVFDGEDNPVISIRDNVKIDEKGIAENGAKFDYEIVEPGARFNFKAELICENLEFAHKIFSEIVQGFNCGDILLGAKTSRGLGRILIINPKYMAIDLSKNIKDYIDFNWEKVSNEFISAKKNLNLYETLKIKITVNTFIFIRNYACVTPDKLNNNKLVDAEQLSHQDGSAVIPGTSYGGKYKGRIRTDGIGGNTEYIDEAHLLWGDKNKNKIISNEYTSLSEDRGMQLLVPFIVPVGENAFIKIRNYLSSDLDIFQFDDWRMVEFFSKKVEMEED